MRFGLLDGKRHTYGEIGQEIGVGRERSRQIERSAIVKMKRRRNPTAAFAVGFRAGRAAPPTPDSVRASRADSTGPIGASDKSETVIGDRWRFQDSRWAIIWDDAAGKVATREISGSRRSSRSIPLATVPAVFCDGMSEWLERIRREHEWEPQSLAFLVGALDGAIPHGSRFKSAGALGTALDFN